jgi:hypothetical protein
MLPEKKNELGCDCQTKTSDSLPGEEAELYLGSFLLQQKF